MPLRSILMMPLLRRNPQLPQLARGRRVSAPAMATLAFLLLSGCSHFHSRSSAEYVYVVVKQAYLRDRVAVVANRVAEVTNGERLEVVEHGRRFLNVRTPQGAAGWIEEHAVIDQNEFDTFQALTKRYAAQQPIATALLYNELYAHISPGRKTQHFYLFPANTKVAMLERASVPRQMPGGVLGLSGPTARPSATQARAAVHGGKPHRTGFEAQFLPPVPMEDWWLVRDTTGRTGWMLARDLSVDVPDEVAKYAEGQRMLGAYVLRTVDDPDSDRPNGQVPEYLTVLTPYKDGLPFDFDQVRVFTWDQKRHRYGTAFRLRDVAGFFPVKVMTHGGANGASEATPVFSLQLAVDDSVSLDPQTGMPHATQVETRDYRLDGNLVHRVLPATASPAATANPIRRGSSPNIQRNNHRRVRPGSAKPGSRKSRRQPAPAPPA